MDEVVSGLAVGMIKIHCRAGRPAAQSFVRGMVLSRNHAARLNFPSGAFCYFLALVLRRISCYPGRPYTCWSPVVRTLDGMFAPHVMTCSSIKGCPRSNSNATVLFAYFLNSGIGSVWVALYTFLSMVEITNYLNISRFVSAATMISVRWYPVIPRESTEPSISLPCTHGALLRSLWWWYSPDVSHRPKQIGLNYSHTLNLPLHAVHLNFALGMYAPPFIRFPLHEYPDWHSSGWMLGSISNRDNIIFLVLPSKAPDYLTPLDYWWIEIVTTNMQAHLRYHFRMDRRPSTMQACHSLHLTRPCQLWVCGVHLYNLRALICFQDTQPFADNRAQGGAFLPYLREINLSQFANLLTSRLH